VANERNLYYQEQLVKFMDFYQDITKFPPVREGYEVNVKG
jgi:hypothetical protein